jgi:hypothetical protein
MSSDVNANRPYWSLLFLGVVDFICIMIGLENLNSGRYTSAMWWIGFGVVSGLCGYGWERYRARKTPGVATKESQSAQNAVTRADWLQLAKDFESCPRDLRADYSRCGKPGVDTWWIGGGCDASKCRALCALAGSMLLRSPHVLTDIQDEIFRVSEPTYRWLYFLKSRKGLDNLMYAIETLDDGQTAPVYSAFIKQLPEVSAAACIDCAAKET